MITKKHSVLFVVQAGKKYGTGHLKRILKIAPYCETPFLWIITDLKEVDPLRDLVKEFPHQITDSRDKIHVSDILKDTPYDFIVSDCVNLNNSLVLGLNECPIPMISFDNAELGLSSEIHIAPLPSAEYKQANFLELYHTPINKEFFMEKTEYTGVKNVLVTIGGSDPHNIAEKVIKTLKDTPFKVTVIAGPFSNYKIEESDQVTIVKNITNIAPYIKNNDLVVCGPGFTMLEVLAANKYIVVIAHNLEQYQSLKPIPLLNPLLESFLLTPKKIKTAINKASIGRLNIPEGFSFEKWWLELSDNIAGRPASCPLCGSYHKTSIARNSSQNQFSCNNCDSTYLYYIHPLAQEENLDFIVANNVEQAQQGYKRAVLKQKEDSNRRVLIIKKILPIPTYQSYKLIDIGAEHGIFVQESSHNGFSAQGVELSKFSRRLALENNNITLVDSMDKVYETGPIYNIVTAWKNIELLENPYQYMKKLSSIVTLGGLLAFRIPVVTPTPFNKGFFRVTEKGGRFLAERVGINIVQTSRFVNEYKEEFIEFYGIKRSEA